LTTLFSVFSKKVKALTNNFKHKTLEDLLWDFTLRSSLNVFLVIKKLCQAKSPFGKKLRKYLLTFLLKKKAQNSVLGEV
jgi:hypothetical protein